MRVKLAARGGGRWQGSGGYRSKFGLTVAEILKGLDLLKSKGMEDCFKLLHFHLGSQIPNIRIVKGALNEAARVYVELSKLGAGPRVPRRRRRPGRRLRRLADELRVEHQLHARGVRQRRRLPHPERLRRRRRAAPDHRLRERARRGGLPQRAGVQRARRLGLRRRSVAAVHPQRRSRAAHRRSDRDLPEPDGAQRARGVPRRAAGAGHGDRPVQRRLPAAAAAQPGREPLLGDLREAPAARPADGGRARGPAGAGRGALGHVLLQLLAVPVDSRQLGHQAALPDRCRSTGSTSARRPTPCSATSPATPTARSTSSSTGAT